MNKEEIKEVKKFFLRTLNHRPWCCTTDCPVEWAKVFFPQISKAIHDEEYELAQALKDAVRIFLNQFLDKPNKIKKSATLKLPEYVETKVYGIVCLGDPDDPLGMKSGGAIIL